MEALRREEVSRGLTFEYCLITAGTSLNRAPSDQVWHDGDIMSLDSGGNYKGYIGDLCRMAILGEPDASLSTSSPRSTRSSRRRGSRSAPGARGGDIWSSAGEGLSIGHRQLVEFVAHGMGLISHEAPRLAGRGSLSGRRCRPAPRVRDGAIDRDDTPIPVAASSNSRIRSR